MLGLHSGQSEEDPMRSIIRCMALTAIVSLIVSSTSLGSAATAHAEGDLQATPVLDWSREAQRAIVPAGPGGIFGQQNYGNKFPGEAAVYMGIVHAAIYDAAVAIEGGFRPYAAAGVNAPNEISSEAAIATAAYRTLVGLYGPFGLDPAKRPILDSHYDAYMDRIADGEAKSNGIRVGEQVAGAVLEARADDGRDKNPSLIDLGPPPSGPGVWDPGSAPPLGLRMPGIRPLALESGSQFRPDGPNPLVSTGYTEDFDQVAALGRSDSASRTDEQTAVGLFWTDHDLRQWNDGLLALASAHDLSLVQTARMLAMAHVAGGDAMIACFDAKYHYWFWRPYQAIPRGDADGNAATTSDPTWRPLGTTPNFPEYPSAHACHTTAIAETLHAFFGTDRVPFSLDSRITGTTRTYERFHEVAKEVNWARVLVGFHFRNSDQEGSVLGRKVARFVTDRLFQSL